MKRESGILLPIFSLWGQGGIGTLGEEARAFVNFLAEARQSHWQVLPAGPTGYGDSPYQSYSSFAGNPYFIELAELEEQGLIPKGSGLLGSGSADYGLLWDKKITLLREAYAKGSNAKKQAAFAKAHPRIEDYASFMALKKHFGYQARSAWPEARYKSGLSPQLKTQLKDEIGFHLFVQDIFLHQWRALKSFANKKGIRIIGDIPIYVAEDSADLWANPEYFLLQKDGRLSAVAGVPPDYFSETGQLWGNPLYNWKALEADGFGWWIERIQASYELYDMVRIDHFRGFESFWQVPFGDDTAQNGVWKKAKGHQLFEAVKAKLGSIDAIAEDLGVITPPVKKLIKGAGFPGMKVLLFAFYAGQESDYMPHKYKDENCVVYTGTHDNDTVAGWFASGGAEDIAAACTYLKLSSPTAQEFARGYVDAAWRSKARLAIAPLQDILALGNGARINRPSTLGGNWCWRMEGPPPAEAKAFLAKLTQECGRN